MKKQQPLGLLFFMNALMEEAFLWDSCSFMRQSVNVTTQEEMEAFFIIKSILRSTVRSQIITFRDAQTYFVVFMDDNNRHPVCQLYLNGKKQIGLFDADKKEVKHQLNTLADIYNFSQPLVDLAVQYPDTFK
ncbi:MAG: hypothetical protein V4714_02305 [Bacteroidota bacterium]